MADEETKDNPNQTKAKLVPVSVPRTHGWFYNAPPMPQSKAASSEKSLEAPFDPEALRKQAEQIIAEGKMPPPDKFFAALEKIRQEYAPKVMKTRQHGNGASDKK
jgi:hypothetical protein